MNSSAERESIRLDLLASLDAEKSQLERNKLGQFATPPQLAQAIVNAAVSLLSPKAKIRFLEPGFGTGSFFSALCREWSSRIEFANGYEIDPHYGNQSKKLWGNTCLELTIGDFTTASPPSSLFNLVVCNPPYVRHHHLSQAQKVALGNNVSKHTALDMSGLSGLYAYFMVLSQRWMADGGIAAWLVPSEFMDVNYGQQVKHFLLERVSLLRIHRFDPSEVQFDDALVSSAVVIFKNSKPKPTHSVMFSFGGGLSNPQVKVDVPNGVLRESKKWTRFPHNVKAEATHTNTLSDLFTIKRGLATGCNSYFILSAEQVREYGIPDDSLIPILPSPRYLSCDEIEAGEDGNPLIERQLFLLSSDLPEEEIKHRSPSLWRYIQKGRDAGIQDGYLCSRREPWYSQEKRPAAPFLCTYMGRSGERNGESPFRFILNHSKATAANVYLMLYPKERLSNAIKGQKDGLRKVWAALSSITPAMLVGEGRIYGGGLFKIEPKELANVSADIIMEGLSLPGDRGPSDRRRHGSARRWTADPAAGD